MVLVNLNKHKQQFWVVTFGGYRIFFQINEEKITKYYEDILKKIKEKRIETLSITNQVKYLGLYAETIEDMKREVKEAMEETSMEESSFEEEDIQ